MRFIPRPPQEVPQILPKPLDVVCREAIYMCEAEIRAKNCRVSLRKIQRAKNKLFAVLGNGSAEWQKNEAIKRFCFSATRIDPQLGQCLNRLLKMC